MMAGRRHPGAQVLIEQSSPLVEMPVILHDRDLHPPGLRLLDRRADRHIRIQDSFLTDVSIVLLSATPAGDHDPAPA